ncbi:MAG TPA: hypothetical protein VEB86_19290, partial [Chryseosolibacter sp.]|nr:hypothetical protein [Chryseosolibacter sp.]
INSLPGFKGNLMLRTFGALPYLNRLVKRTYEFLALDGIFVLPGFENVIEGFFENLLHRYAVHSAIMIADADSSLYCFLRSLNLGLIDKINKEVRGHVICKFYKFSAVEIDVFKSRPAYISGIDVT